MRFEQTLLLLSFLGALLLPGRLRATEPSPTWGREPVKSISPTRGEIVLNGLWRFLPASNTEDFGPTSTAANEWGLIWVPGDWRPAYNWPRSGMLPGVIEKGPKPFDASLERGTYARPLLVPKEWEGRRILLELRRVSTDATVWLDGKTVGKIKFPGGELDLTEVVRPGSQQELRIQVVADGGGEETMYLEGTMGDANAIAKKINIPHRGLVDDVVLRSLPLAHHIAAVFVKTSVKNSSMSVEVKFAGEKPTAAFPLKATISENDGTVVSSFETTVNPNQLVNSGDGGWLCKAEWVWKNPKLWSPDAPNLYTLLLSASGTPVAHPSPGLWERFVGFFYGSPSAQPTPQPWDVFHQRFGFREFGIEGRRFLLNGTPIRLRPTVAPTKYQARPSPDFKWGEGSYHTRETLRAALLGLKRLGFNTVEEWPEGPFNRDRVVYHDQLHELCDELGLFVLAELPTMVPLARDGSWSQRERRLHWEEKTARWIASQRNHPSIIAWIHSPNFFGQNALTQGPLGLGNQALMELENLNYQKSATIGRAANAFIKSQDSTRPVTTHHGATVGDFLAVNTYLNHTPQQELEDWWADYISNADIPFLAIEYEFPISYSFQSARWLARNGGNGERFFTEWIAARMGPETYLAEPEFIRKGHREHWTGNPKQWTNMHKFLDTWDLWNTYPAFATMMCENVTRQLRAQRTWGLDGGVIPWELHHLFTHESGSDARVNFGPFVPGTRGIYQPSAPLSALQGAPPEGSGTATGFAAALRPWLQPSLAWIAGGPDRFTRKDSRFHAGETIEKQLALINDHETQQAYHFIVTSEVADSRCEPIILEGNLAPGEIKFLPLQFSAPQTQ